MTISRRLTTLAATLGAVLLVASGFVAADWPQWLGPERDGTSQETDWDARWGEGEPEVVWTAELGQGFSAVSVVDDRLYTMGNADGHDIVWCLDVKTGRPVWKRSYPCDKGSHPGPRSTPTVDRGLVFTMSRNADMYCLDARTGAVKWSKNLIKEHGVDPAPRGWGLACSPLVLGEAVVMDLGKVMAFDRTTGKLLWEVGDDKPSFSSPVAFTYGGKTYVTGFNTSGLIIVDVAAKKQVAEFGWTTDWDCNAPTPVVSGNKIFITSGYGHGCALLEFDGSSLEKVYENKTLAMHCGTPVLYEGHLYGISGQMGSNGRLVCMNLATGKPAWVQSRYRVGGGAILAGDKLIVFQDKGKLEVVEADPGTYKRLSSAEVVSGQTWTAPVLADGRIFVRNNRAGKLVCLDVRTDQ